MRVLKIISVIGLGALLLFSLVRLQKNIIHFGNDSIQTDFSVIYTAGQSLNSAFPIYKNGIVANPPIWDGTARYVHSRFIYSPLTTAPFALMAGIMPYGAAKFFWMYFSLVCLLVSIFITIRVLKLKLNFWQYMAVAVFASLFFPLLTALERGQIDFVILLLAVIAMSLAVSCNRREITSGFFWAFATLIKIHVGLVVLFFIIRKQWKILAGFLLGGITIVVLTTLFLGPAALGNYLTELPRIVKHGGDGDATEMKLPDSYFEKYYSDYAPGHNSGLAKDGRFYGGVRLSFAWNASLSRFIAMRMQEINKNWQITPSLVSLIILVFLLPLAFLGLKKIQTKIPKFPPDKEYLYWYGVLMLIMLLGPLTWTMTAVWLIPLSALAIGRGPWSSDKMNIVPWFLLVAALFLAFAPDCMYLGWRDFEAPSLLCKALDSFKYIFSELLVIASIWLQIAEVSVFEKIKKPQSPALLK